MFMIHYKMRKRNRHDNIYNIIITWKNVLFIHIYTLKTFFKFIFISCRLITLQYCSGFFLPYIDMNQPWIYMCSPSWTPPSTSLPITSPWIIPVHQPWALVSCIEPGLVICFTLDNVHVSMLFSQIIPPSPSPSVQKSVLYICVSFAVSDIGSSLPSF